MTQLTTPLLIHYSANNKDFTGIDISSLQESIGKNINVLDVVLLAYQCLAGQYPGKTFVDEFARLYHQSTTLSGPTHRQYNAANCVYFGVKQHVKNALGLTLPGTFPKFRITFYAFGQNKQTFAIVIEPLRLSPQCHCHVGGH